MIREYGRERYRLDKVGWSMDTAAVIKAYSTGVSIRTLAKAHKVDKGAIRRVLIVSGAIALPQSKKCRACKELFKPTLSQAANGRTICARCESENLHVYQLAKVNCTPDQYTRLLNKQNGGCAICGKVFGHISKSGIKCRLAVDHEHKTGRLRGLLCSDCNRALGYFKDSVPSLIKAIEYLKRST